MEDMELNEHIKEMVCKLFEHADGFCFDNFKSLSQLDAELDSIINETKLKNG